MQDSVVTASGANLEVQFTAEAAASGSSRMFVRALVDGQVASPSDVVFVKGGWDGVRSFTFTKSSLAAGVHSVRIQWHADAGATSHLGDRTLILRSATETGDDGRLFVRTAPSGPWVQLATSSWMDIPHLSQSVNLAEAGHLALSLSAEAFVTGNGRMFVRAMIDDELASPGNAVFAVGSWRGSRAMTFVQENLSVGTHSVRFQWWVDAGETASIGDRSVSVFAAPGCSDSGGLVVKAAPSGVSKTTTGSVWVDIPDMSVDLRTSEDSAVEIKFSAESFVSSGQRMFIRALIDGQVAGPSDVVFADLGFNGTHSFSFTKDHVGPGLHTVRIQWHTDVGGTATVGDRTLVVSSLRPQRWHRFAHPDQPHDFFNNPDLPASIETLFRDSGATVELPVLVVLLDFDDRRPDSGHTPAYYADLFFGRNRANGSPSVFETYRENSNGRLLLVPAAAGDFHGAPDGVVGWVTAQNQNGCCRLSNGSAADVTQSQCQQMGGSWTPGSFAYYGCFIERKRAEGMRRADPFFDYSRYDRNGDGTVTSDELVVIVVNAASGFGANARYTDPRRVPVDGGVLEVHQLVTGVTESGHTGILSHEIGHQAFGLSDLYQHSSGVQVSDGYTSGGAWFPPDPARYSLMGGGNPASILSHLDPWAKIHLGFLRPKVVTTDGLQRLFDMETDRDFAAQEDEPEAIILYDPDLPDPYKEYFILENRDRVNRSYGTGAQVLDRGLAVWHINERQGSWPNGIDLRKTIHLLRRADHWASESSSLWDGSSLSDGYDLTPNSIPQDTSWASGLPSGIHVTRISPAGPVMTFEVGMPLIGMTDGDNDRIPDSWELANGLKPNDGNDAELDSDGDGASNREEYRAGTDPQDASSLLAIHSILTSPNGTVTIRFQAAANRTYSVLYSDGIKEKKWEVLGHVSCRPVNRLVEVSDATALTKGSQRFYRIVTPKLPD